MIQEFVNMVLRRFSWYDSLIVASAVEADRAILCSEDFHEGQRFAATRVKNPFA